MIMIYRKDIAHCMGSGCKLKSNCYRYWLYTVFNRSHSKHQAVFIFEQFNRETNQCPMFREKGEQHEEAQEM